MHSLSLFFVSHYKIYLEIRHSFLNLPGPLLPVGTQDGHKSHLYIFIRNLFTRVLTILLAISHANSNDPSSSASYDWPGGRGDRPELKCRARDTINPKQFLLILWSLVRYRSSDRGTTARRVDDFESKYLYEVSGSRLSREPKAFKDFQVLFFSRHGALRINYFLAGSERGPLNEGPFVVDGRAHATVFSGIKDSLESKYRTRSDLFAYIVPLLIYNRHPSLAYTSHFRLRILSTLPRLSSYSSFSHIRINTYS